MQTTQQPSTFAQIIDKLRSKSEEELKQFYTQLSEKNINGEQKGISKNDSTLNQKKNTEGKNNLDKVFGIWKDKNITLNSIREEAWQRTK